MLNNGVSSDDSFYPEVSKVNSELFLITNSQSISLEEVSSPREAISQKITVILPAFNEEVSIGSIVLLTRRYADRVIVVDDGSSDRTVEIALKVGAEVIVHETNKGKGVALKTGFEAAKDSDIIVTMDSDGQHNPAEIPKLVAPILEGKADVVNGSRYLNKVNKNTPIYRRIGQAILDKFTNINSGVKVTDSQSGFRAFAGYTKEFFRFQSNGMAIESEMLADIGKAGIRVKEVEIGVRYDVDCSTVNPIKHGVSVLVRILNDMKYNRPLYYFTVPGIVLGMSGIYMGLTILRILSLGGGTTLGLTVLMIMLTLVGTFMAFTGIILHSITGVIMSTKRI